MALKLKYDYPMKITQVSPTRFEMTCPSLPEVTAAGDSHYNAMQMGERVINYHLSDLMLRGAEIPTPKRNHFILQTGSVMEKYPMPPYHTLRLRLYMKLREDAQGHIHPLALAGRHLQRPEGFIAELFSLAMDPPMTTLFWLAIKLELVVKLTVEPARTIRRRDQMRVLD